MKAVCLSIPICVKEVPRFLSHGNNMDFASCSTEPALRSTIVQELSKEDRLRIAKARRKWPTPQLIGSEVYFHHSPLFSETLAFSSPLRSPYAWRGGRERRKVFLWGNLSSQGSVLNCLPGHVLLLNGLAIT